MTPGRGAPPVGTGGAAEASRNGKPAARNGSGIAVPAPTDAVKEFEALVRASVEDVGPDGWTSQIPELEASGKGYGLTEDEIGLAISRNGPRKGRPRQSPQRPSPSNTDYNVVCMEDVAPELIRWLWPGRIPFGKLTVVEGDPKVGKSTLLLDVAARVTTGAALPDGHLPASGSVLILTAEDGLADTVRPRLDAAGADQSKVFAWESVPVIDEDGNPAGIRPPSIPRDLATLETLIVEKGIVLVVIDVLNAYLGADVDGHKDQDIRRALMPLAKLAEQTGAAIVVLRHLNKSTGGPAIYRGAGSIGIAGAARSVLLVGMDPDDEEHRRRVLLSQGSNVAEDPPALAYELVTAEEHGCARVRWMGRSEHTTGSLLAVSSEERTALAEAADILADILSDEPVGAKDVQGRAADAGISGATLRRAKDRLGVRSVKRAGRWVWTLPEDAQEETKVLKPPGMSTLSTLAADQDFQGDHGAHGAQGAQGSESEHLEQVKGWPCPVCGTQTLAVYGAGKRCRSCFDEEPF